MKTRKWLLSIVLFAFIWPLSQAQTIGLMLQTPQSFDGHTLFAPNSSRTVFLIDNCGYELNRWATDHSPGLAVYLLENGDLLKTSRISSSFNGGGSGGRVERRSWENELLWAYNFSSSTYHQHHDIEPLPNGNMLVIAWEAVEANALDSSGRQTIGSSGLWSSYIFEVTPVGVDQIAVVWEWRAWDHLIQDKDSLLHNFGVIADHPERIDANLDPGQSADWLHVNGIDYNARLDQIAISAHDIDEILVIDHSTSTEEAQTSSGGRYGKGGDILYRWGNPQNYGRGTVSDQKLFGQHDIRWIEDGKLGEGSFMVFNNGMDRPSIDPFSTVEVWTADQDSAGYYHIEVNGSFGPQQADWNVGEGDVKFYSSRISGAQRLENGNTLICNGRGGQFFEVDSIGTLVWEYVNPVANSPLVQGTIPFANDVFRATKYATNYPAFIGRNLVQGDPLELQPLPYECELFSPNETIETQAESITIYPNPVHDELNVEIGKARNYTFQIINLYGQMIFSGKANGSFSIKLNELVPGLYHLLLRSDDKKVHESIRFVMR